MHLGNGVSLSGTPRVCVRVSLSGTRRAWKVSSVERKGIPKDQSQQSWGALLRFAPFHRERDRIHDLAETNRSDGLSGARRNEKWMHSRRNQIRPMDSPRSRPMPSDTEGEPDSDPGRQWPVSVTTENLVNAATATAVALRTRKVFLSVAPASGVRWRQEIVGGNTWSA